MTDQDNRLADMLSPFLLEKSYDPAFDLFTRFPFWKSKIAPSLSTEGQGLSFFLAYLSPDLLTLPTPLTCLDT
jgi:hypothetical protein